MSSTDRNHSRRCRLNEVARVQAGYLSRSRVRGSAQGTHRLLQARDVSADGVCVDTAVRFHPERNAELYRVSAGDILVVARGQDHRANLIDADFDDVLASSVFHIIRPRADHVQPGYLAWWLNQPDVQAEINAGSRGTGIGYISRQVMEQVPVDLPPLDVQERIAAVMRLSRRRSALQAQLDTKRQQMIHAICGQAVRQDKE